MKGYTVQLIALLTVAVILMSGCSPGPGPVPPTEITWPATRPPAPTAIPASPTVVPPTPLPYPPLQAHNDLPLRLLSPRSSSDLPDNHIGVHFEDYERYSNTGAVFTNGFKWVRIQSLTDFWADNRIDLKTFDLESIPPSVDGAISEYASNDVNVILDLWMGAGLQPYGTTFRSRDEVDRFLKYVWLVVSHFEGRIPYYEIWNEPGDIAVSDYAALVRAVVPVIREADPQAKIIIGAIPGSWEDGYPGYGEHQRFSLDIGYLNGLLRSGVLPLVDGVSWHPFYDNIPSDPYYQDYPQMLAGIKELAQAEGFTGEYFADELLWKPVVEEDWVGGPPVSPTIAAKYYARAIALHRGFGVNVTMNTFFLEPEREFVPKTALSPVHNLADALAGAEPAPITLSIASEATNISQYGFSLPNGDRLAALWTNGEAVENDPGMDITLTVSGLTAQRVIGIDVLHGFEQDLIFEADNGNLVIRDLKMMDYPILLRFIR